MYAAARVGCGLGGVRGFENEIVVEAVEVGEEVGESEATGSPSYRWGAFLGSNNYSGP